MKAGKQRVQVKRLVLAGLMVGAVLAASSVAHAVSAPSAGKPSTREATVLDPFSLKTVTVPSTPRSEKLGSPPSPTDLKLLRSVRVPSKPPCRSAFKPDLDWRPTAG